MVKIENYFIGLSDNIDVHDLSSDKKLGSKIENFIYSNKSDNKKSQSLNIEISNNDLLVIDHLSNILGLKRSELLNYYISYFTSSLFDSIQSYEDQKKIALLVDNQISNENLNHQYEDKTWMLRLMLSDSYPHLENSINNTGKYHVSIFDIKKGNNNG
jgi:hypothetical protein